MLYIGCVQNTTNNTTTSKLRILGFRATMRVPTYVLVLLAIALVIVDAKRSRYDKGTKTSTKNKRKEKPTKHAAEHSYPRFKEDDVGFVFSWHQGREELRSTDYR